MDFWERGDNVLPLLLLAHRENRDETRGSMFLSVGGISMYREKVVGDQWMPVIINLYLPREAGESTNREVFSIYHRYSI